MSGFVLILAGILVAAHLFSQPLGIGAAEEQSTGAQTVRPCRASDLDAIWGRISAATGGQLWGRVLASNHSDDACELRGIPSVEILGVEGAPLDITVRPCGPMSPLGLSECNPDYRTVLMPSVDPQSAVHPGPGQAVMLLAWRIHDGAGNCSISIDAIEPATTLRLTIPGDEQSIWIPIEAGNDLGRAVCDPGGLVTSYPFYGVD